VEVAVEEMAQRGEKINVSRVTALTGVHRKDVDQIYKQGETLDPSMQIGRRVIAQWRRDKRFLDSSGRPKILSLENQGGDFARLVRVVSREFGHAAVLFQLENMGAIERTQQGLKLKIKGYQPDRKSLENYRLMGEDAEDLMMAVLSNVSCEEDSLPNIHVKVQFDNLDKSDIAKVRNWFNLKCFQWHQQTEKFLSKLDLDITPNRKKRGGERVVLGIFTRT